MYFIRFVLICLIVYAAAWWGVYHLNARFTLSHIIATKDQPTHPTTDVLTPELRTMLEGSFSYLSHGSQMIVFESQDHQYVLKLFRLNRYRPPVLLRNFLNSPVKEQKLIKLYESCSIAATELKECTALCYCHFHSSEKLNVTTTLIDKLHRTMTLDLGQSDFVIQKKCLGVMSELSKPDAKEKLDLIVHLLHTRAEHGIDDCDCVIAKNIGFLEGKAVYIDIGQFSRSTESEERRRTEKKHALLNFQKNLPSHLSAHLLSHID